MNYIQEYSKVISNKLISENMWETILESPKIAQIAKPGQFINIFPEKKWNYVMRRPMSIASQGNGEISIIYKANGEGTRIMANWGIDTKVDLFGPLGNYWEDNNTDFHSSTRKLALSSEVRPFIDLENLDFENKGYIVKHNNKRYMFLSKEYQ